MTVHDVLARTCTVMNLASAPHEGWSGEGTPRNPECGSRVGMRRFSGAWSPVVLVACHFVYERK